jgi:hypothetical protein
MSSPIVILGTVRDGNFKEPKQPESKAPKPLMLNVQFALAAADADILASLCASPQEAAKAFRAVKLAGGKAEIPCKSDVQLLAWVKAGNKKAPATSQGVTLCKVVLDARKDDAHARARFTQAMDRRLVDWILEMLGKDMELRLIDAAPKLEGMKGEAAASEATGK